MTSSIVVVDDETLSYRVTLLTDLFSLVATYDPPNTFSLEFLALSFKILRAAAETEFEHCVRIMLDLKTRIEQVQAHQQSTFIKAQGRLN